MPFPVKITPSHGGSNMWFLGSNRLSTQTSSGPVQPFLHSSWQTTALYSSMGALSPEKLPLPMGASGPPSNTLFFGPSETKTQMAPQLFQPFWTDNRRISLYFTMGRHFPPSKLPLPMGEWWRWPPSNTWFLQPTRVLNPNNISIGSAVFAGFTSVTDRQTTLLGR